MSADIATPDVEHLVTAAELVRRAGISYRQADYWSHAGYLTPEPQDAFGSGYPRQYALSQVRLARTMRDLLAAGFALGPAHRIARSLIADGRAELDGFTITRREVAT